MGIYQNLEKEFDFDIVEEFFGHYTIMVESMEKLIVSLEDEKLFQRNINELFRIFHTIKSAAAYLQLEPIHKVVTLAEEVLEECRTLQGAASEALVEWLLAVSDQLNLYKEDLETDSDQFSKTDPRLIKIPIDYIKN
jgi:two-component system chemotaxis sensor kinase CheA